jgi:phosphoribosylformylglycinamidine synthase
MRYAVAVELRPLEGVADPEGQTIERALPALGFSGVSGVRVGKVVRFLLDADDDDSARRLVGQMCERLLANPVIERAEVSLEGVEARSGPAPAGGSAGASRPSP